MDAFYVYAKYKNDKKWHPEDEKNIDYTNPKIFKLVTLMHQQVPAEESKQESAPDTSAPDTAESVRWAPKTRENKLDKLSPEKITEINAKLFVDKEMAQRSRQRINAFLAAIGHNIKMDWVRAWASVIVPEPPPEIIQQYETYQPESKRHIHVVENNVIQFLCQLREAEPGKTTTFAWSYGSNKAIHLQKLKLQLEKMFTNVEPAIAMMIIGSIGLPMHEIIKPRTFLKNVKKFRFKTLTTDSIIKIILRDQVYIDRISPKVESNQLIEAYSQKENIFEDDGKYSDVDMFFFKQWYSFPTGVELEQILERAQENLNLWCH